MTVKENSVIIITGPTATGKTALSIQLAKELETSIISADSRQCYKELDIGVAKPTKEELAVVKHYFINSHSITEDVNAVTFEQYALSAVDEIFKENNVAVMVGGTGLYIQAFCEGLDEIPYIPQDIRREVIKQYETYGLAFLQEELKEKNPAFWMKAEQQNPQRLIRALEVLYATGRSITDFRKNKTTERDFNIIKIGLQLSKEELHSNINNRVDLMMQSGLLNEVKALLPYRNYNALQTVGYKELFSYFDGNITLNEAIEEIKKNTRQYAKRQITWFKKDAGITWFNPSDYYAIKSFVEERLKEIKKSTQLQS
ncbi:MAG: tRNA (adenosine(37)-N6)-dimethylallyltransferase MiaA [Ilyomonas sp.]